MTALLFDMDGVLAEVSCSYRRAIIEASFVYLQTLRLRAQDKFPYSVHSGTTYHPYQLRVRLYHTYTFYFLPDSILTY